MDCLRKLHSYLFQLLKWSQPALLQKAVLDFSYHKPWCTDDDRATIPTRPEQTLPLVVWQRTTVTSTKGTVLWLVKGQTFGYMQGFLRLVQTLLAVPNPVRPPLYFNIRPDERFSWMALYCLWVELATRSDKGKRATVARTAEQQWRQLSTGEFSSRNQHHTKCLRAEEEAEEQRKRTNMAKETVEVHRE